MQSAVRAAIASMVNGGFTAVEVVKTDASDFELPNIEPEFGSAYQTAGQVRVSNQLNSEVRARVSTS